MKVSAPNRELLKSLDQATFAQLGLPSIAYVKEVKVDGGSGWQVYAADGTSMALLEDREVAFAACMQNELEPMWVH